MAPQRVVRSLMRVLAHAFAAVRALLGRLMRPVGPWLRVRLDPASQQGSVIVEVLVGTLLLGLATAAILDGLDGAQDAGLRNKNRSMAATLAQQDLERLRSLPPTVLNGYEETRTVPVGGVNYTVTSSTQWIIDASGPVSCTSEDTQAEYLELRSTVMPPAPSVVVPVTETTLLTPPVGALSDSLGTVAVKLTDRDGEPLAGVDVDLTGPGAQSEKTNEVGCAIFPFIQSGTWLAEVDGDLVSWDGVSPARSPVTVGAKKTSLTQMEVDEPASIIASFKQPNGDAAMWDDLGVANSRLPGGARFFATSTKTETKPAASLFPFIDGYGVYATTCTTSGGEIDCCDANNPAVWNGSYFQPGGIGHVMLDPGEEDKAVDVLVPLLRITVRRSTSNESFRRVRITVDQRDTSYGCTAELFDSNSVSVPSGTTSYTFVVPVPFGHYRLCGATNQSTSGGTWRRTETGTSTDPDMTVTPYDRAVTITNTSTTGECS